MSQDTNSKKNIHTISTFVANKPGVLVRVAQVFARRAFNIDALVVSPGINPKFSRMTITAQGDAESLDQIIKQTSKLVDVVHASEHTGLDALHLELALIKLKTTPSNKTVITKLVKKHGAKVISEEGKILVVQLSGTTQDVDAFEETVRKYGMLEVVRSGKLVMTKGMEET